MPLTETLIEQLDDALGANRSILAGYIFGSMVRGRERVDSDLDIALLLDEKGGRLDRKQLMGDLFSRIGRLSPRDVHFLILNDAAYPARMEVFRTGRLFHVKDPLALDEFRMVSCSLYADFAPYLRQLHRKLKLRWMQHGE
jgi:predicted nucleotidyltransferase